MYLSIFDQSVRQQIISRITKLSADSIPQWGVMSVDQMMLHCEKSLLNGLWRLQIKRNIISRLVGWFMKKIILSDDPLQKNLPTDKWFITTADHSDIENEKKTLIELITEFWSSDIDFTEISHPFFGKLTREQRGVLQYKHLDHHLRQFNA